MKQSILYLEQNRGIFYNAEKSSMLQLDFPADVVRDLDLLNKDKLYALIQAFVEAYQILPTSLVLLLSPTVTFDKDLTSDQTAGVPDGTRPASEVQSFIDLVPFQVVLSRTFSIGEKKKIVTANKEFIDALQRGFQKFHCDISLVLPFSVIQEIVPELENNFDLGLVLSKVDGLKQYNMLEIEQVKNNQVTLPKTKQKTDSKRLYVLVAIFSILFIIMIVMAITTFTPQPRKNVQGMNTYKTNIPFYTITLGKIK